MFMITASCLGASSENLLLDGIKSPQYTHIYYLDLPTKSTPAVLNTVTLLKMTLLIPSTIPVRVFEEHEARISAVAVFPDKRRMVTSSDDKMLRLWDLTTGVVLKKMEGHCNRVQALAVSQGGGLIASGDTDGKLIAWDGKTGERLSRYRETCPVISAHTGWILSLDFSPDGRVLASGSSDSTTKLWNTETWKLELEGNAIIECGTSVRCIRYSPLPPRLAIATEHNIQIYHSYDRFQNNYPRNYYCYYYFQPSHTVTISEGHSYSLAWTPDGGRLLSAGGGADPTIREWDSSTWKQVGDPWKGHFNTIRAISLNSNGTLLASASHDNRVRLWQVSDRRTIAVFKHSGEVNCVTFSADDRHILSGGVDKKISEWLASEAASSEDGPKDGLMKEQVTHQAQAYSNIKVLAIHSAAHNACIAGDLATAEKVLSLEIDTAPSNHTFYTNRAFVMTRKGNWNHALRDAIKSLSIQPSFTGHISKGIALCGKNQVRVARTSFDLASIFTNGDFKTNQFLFLIKTIALFNANEHEEAMQRIEELALSPNADPIACRIVEAYLRVQLGNIALDSARNNEAVDHFAAAVNASTFFYKLEIHSMYEEFVVLFGWDLKSLWQIVNQQHWHALFRAGRIGAAIESYQSIMDKSDDNMKTGFSAWFAALQ